MKNRLLVNDLKPMRLLVISFLILPIVAACASETAQAPTAPATTSPVPPVATSPTPKVGGTIVEVAASNPMLRNMTAAIQASGLTATLQSQGPFTVFAPTDQAFASVPTATRQRLLQPQNRKTLTQILSYHVVPGDLSSGQLKPGAVKTLEGQTLNVQTGKQVTVNDAKVSQPDIQANNGVIHVIDRIIVPPDVKL
ncbi:MAG: fasciclin domain-containing protein [Phormidesmis sp. CAN_BIN44]|nr:fasciclin domain-containing protein [Phormidesmis sp. CAN_BIN44]